MAIRKRIQTFEPQSEKSYRNERSPYKDIRWPEDFENEELARYFEQKAKVMEMSKPEYFQKNIPESCKPSWRGVMTEHKAYLEAAKRLRSKIVSDTVVLQTTAEEVLNEQEGSGTTSPDSDSPN